MTPHLTQLARFLLSPAAHRLAYTVLRRAKDLFSFLAIEMTERRASPKQLAFQHAFFSRRDPADPAGRSCDLFAALGANRSGKTILCGWLCFAKYLRDHAHHGDWFWCISPTLERSINGQQRELWHALPHLLFGSQTWDPRLGFGSNRRLLLSTRDGGHCLLEFRSADQDPATFEQAKLTGLWCDEQLSESLFNRLLPRLIDRNGFLLYSDLPQQSWQLDRLLEASPQAGVYCQRFTMRDNAHNLPPGAIAQAQARMTADEQRLRIEGEFVTMEGLVYREYQEAVHAIDPFPIPPDWPRWRLIDYGASAPTACLWAAIAPNETLFIYREHYQCNRSIADNARQILCASGDESYRTTFIDPCACDLQPGMTQTIARQYAAAGLGSITPWPRVNQMGEHAMVQKVKYRLENHRLKVFKTCPNCRREFRSWKYKTDAGGNPIAADAFEHGHDHTLDCIKGFVATLPTFSPPTVRLLSG